MHSATEFPAPPPTPNVIISYRIKVNQACVSTLGKLINSLTKRQFDSFHVQRISWKQIVNNNSNKKTATRQ
jgi:hypothetical protein